MQIKQQGELLSPTDVVNLTSTFYDQGGNPTNTDYFPTISLVMPSGLVGLPPTSAGVQQIDVGKYAYQFTIPFNGPYGVWAAIWQGSVYDITTVNTTNFVVFSSNLPAVADSDGSIHLGEDCGFDYSQLAIRNINKLMKTLRARLNSSGKSKTTDGYGNVIYVDCDIFSVDMLTSFIANALTDFNQVPYFTFFTFEDTYVIDQFHDILVEGATLMALASQALIEKGREFTITDNGVNFTPPAIAELLTTQYSTLLTSYTDKLKMIKNSMRPKPIGLGTFSMMGSANPLIKNLRLLRARQIF
jgi:hypothetical protein